MSSAWLCMGKSPLGSIPADGAYIAGWSPGKRNNWIWLVQACKSNFYWYFKSNSWLIANLKLELTAWIWLVQIWKSNSELPVKNCSLVYDPLEINIVLCRRSWPICHLCMRFILLVFVKNDVTEISFSWVKRKLPDLVNS